MWSSWARNRVLAAFRQRALSDARLSAVVVPIGRGELLAARITYGY